MRAGRRAAGEGGGSGERGRGAEPGPAQRSVPAAPPARSPLPTARKRPRSAFPEDEDFLPPIERCPGVSTQPWGSRRAGRVPVTPPPPGARLRPDPPPHPPARPRPPEPPYGWGMGTRPGMGTAARRPLLGAAPSKAAIWAPDHRGPPARRPHPDGRFRCAPTALSVRERRGWARSERRPRSREGPNAGSTSPFL